MKTEFKIDLSRNQKGATIILVAVLMTLLIGFSALAIDVGYLYVARNQLQNVADAAALAAARQLGFIYEGKTYSEQVNYICEGADKKSIILVAQEVSESNSAAGVAVYLNDSEIRVGRWDDWKTGSDRTENPSRPNAVHVIARRDDRPENRIEIRPVSTFFAKILGFDEVGVSAVATAALTGLSTIEPGELKIPVGISSYWFENNSCNDEIRFAPTNDPAACAGWNTFDISPANSNRVLTILEDGLKANPNYPAPDVVIGETEFSYIGGQLSNHVYKAMLDLLQMYGNDADINKEAILGDNGEPLKDATGHVDAIPLLKNDGTPMYYSDGVTPRNFRVWDTYVVVYDWDDCSNPNKSIAASGFAQIRMTDVLSPPDGQSIVGQVICNYIDPDENRGGGGEFGLMGSVPGLVE